MLAYKFHRSLFAIRSSEGREKRVNDIWMLRPQNLKNGLNFCFGGLPRETHLTLQSVC